MKTLLFLNFTLMILCLLFVGYDLAHGRWTWALLMLIPALLNAFCVYDNLRRNFINDGNDESTGT